MGADLREKVKALLFDMAKDFLHYDLDVAKHTVDDVRAVIHAFPDPFSALIGGALQKFMGVDVREKVKALLFVVAKEVLFKDLDVAKHSDDDVRAVIDAFPDALSALMGGVLPIQKAATSLKAFPFIPLFAAEEGDRLNVGGEGMRGGLLVKLPHPSKYNLLQVLAINSIYDSMCVTAMKRLRQSNLLRKEDIHHFSLISNTSKPTALRKARFEYLVDWDPTSLKFHYNGGLCLHGAVKFKSVSADSFAVVLQAGLKHYPEELGLLFEKNRKGKTAFELAFEKFGKDATWAIIENCFEDTRDVRIVERNPATNVYPFMIAAAGKASDLSTLYYLLRRNPEVHIISYRSRIRALAMLGVGSESALYNYCIISFKQLGIGSEYLVL